VKIDYLKDGSDDCPLVRLYDFNSEEAQRLRRMFQALAEGSTARVCLEAVESVDGTHLTFVRSARDGGVTESGSKNFEVALTFVLVSRVAPRPESMRSHYRCQKTFRHLYAWLRGKGVTANKPLHELRKELGALITSEHGIYSASRFLRHSDIATTARHYADQKTRITVGLGKYLVAPPVPEVPKVSKAKGTGRAKRLPSQSPSDQVSASI